mgnify:FL=1
MKFLSHACTKFGTQYLLVWNKSPTFAEKYRIMPVLNFTSREFRNQQAYVFDLADKGEIVIISRSRKQAYTLVPVADDDLAITPELQTRIDQARAAIEAGNCITLKTHEDIEKYFNSL